MEETSVKIGEHTCRIIYSLSIQGTPIVLLHGYSFTSKVWKEIGLLDKFEEESIPFIAVDMPYGARSNCKPKTNDIATNIILLDEILEKTLGKKDGLIIVGASLGGYVALNYAAENNTRGLILIAPVGTKEEKLRNKIRRLRIPILIIYGDKDTIVSKSEMENFVKETPRGKLKIYENAGHPAYLYQKETFVKDVISFYKKTIQ